MKSTLQQLRERTSLSRSQFSKLGKFSYHALRNHERNLVLIPLSVAVAYADNLALFLEEDKSTLLLQLAGLKEIEEPNF